jgi:hypothetical protein
LKKKSSKRKYKMDPGEGSVGNPGKVPRQNVIPEKLQRFVIGGGYAPIFVSDRITAINAVISSEPGTYALRAGSGGDNELVISYNENGNFKEIKLYIFCDRIYTKKPVGDEYANLNEVITSFLQKFQRPFK